jgi:hypothetical protein
MLYFCFGGDVLTWNVYKLQGFSGNFITWLEVYIGFGLGEMHTSSSDSGIQMAIFWHLCNLFVSLCGNISYGGSQGICMKVRSSSVSWPLLQTVQNRKTRLFKNCDKDFVMIAWSEYLLSKVRCDVLM